MPSLEVVRDAYLEQWSVSRSWMSSLDDVTASASSILPEWSVRELVAHYQLVAESVVAISPADPAERALSLSDYVRTYAGGADAIAQRTKSQGARGLPEVLNHVDQASAAASEMLLGSSFEGKTVVRARRGPIRWDDFIVTRCIEVAVHSDDLNRSVPEVVGPPVTGPCLKVAVRALVGIFADRAPGRSVEVRVPPYAAVQAVAGPRHTRGTPSAVVEMAPLTMLRLATGRIAWAEAVSDGSVQASGERTELSEWLPLLA